MEEVIVDGENGFLVNFFSPSEIATRVDEILNGARSVRKIREEAREAIVERFDLKRVCLPRHLALLGVTGH